MVDRTEACFTCGHCQGITVGVQTIYDLAVIYLLQTPRNVAVNRRSISFGKMLLAVE